MAMTFWGKENFRNAHAHTPGHEVHDQDHATPLGHVHEPHESPKSMWIPLVVLAVLATLGGFVGISTAFTGGKLVGGRLNIVHWLNPVIWNPTTKSFHRDEPFTAAEEAKIAETPHTSELRVTEPTEQHSGFNLAHAIEGKLHNETLTEWLFIVLSLAAAGIGIGLGLLFYIKDTRLADVWAARLAPLYRASYNKYWIDEFFGWAVTRRTMDLARAIFAFDSKVVDGAVNGIAGLTRFTSRMTGGTDKYLVDGMVNAISNFVVTLMSPIVRAAQTGFTSNYALVMVIGLLVAVGLFFGKDVALAVKSFFGFIW